MKPEEPICGHNTDYQLWLECLYAENMDPCDGEWDLDYEVCTTVSLAMGKSQAPDTC